MRACRPFVVLLGTILLSTGCDNLAPPEPSEPASEKIRADLVAFSGHPAAAHDDDYPILVYWIGGEPAWEPLRLAVEAAVRRWSHIIAPTPTAPYVLTAPVECGHGSYGWLDFDAGYSFVEGLHLFVSTGPSLRNPVSRHNERYRRVSDSFGWAAECVPRSWMKTENHFYRPADSQYNPVTNTTPAGIIGLPADRWGSSLSRDFYELTPRHAYVTALHLIGHVLGVGTGETWWDNMEVERGFGWMTSTADTTYWVESDYPAAFFADSTAVAELSQVLEGQGRPYDGKMIPLWIGGMNIGCCPADTTFRSPVHWNPCLIDGPSFYDREAGRSFTPTGELMGGDFARFHDPRITASTLAALQGFKVRPFSAEYMFYDTWRRRGCLVPRPDSTS